MNRKRFFISFSKAPCVPNSKIFIAHNKINTKKALRLFALVLFLASYVLMGAGTLQEPHLVKVGVYENAPKIYTDESGRVTGFWGELVKTIAEKENWNIQWVSCTWDVCLDKLASGEIDMMPDVAWSQERSEQFDFSTETVLISWSRVYVPEDSSIETILDLDGKTVAGLTGSVNIYGPEGLKDLEEKFNISSQIIELDSYTEVFEALDAHSVDAGVVNNFFGDVNEGKFNLSRTPIIFQPSNIQFAFTKNGISSTYLIERIDAEIKRLKDDPDSDYYQALDQYLGEELETSFIEVIPTWVISLIVSAGGLIIFLVFVSLTSRAIANRQTAQLRTSESRIRAIIENIPDLIMRSDTHGQILDLHVKEKNRFFIKTDELVDRNIRDVFPADISDRIMQTIHTTLASLEMQVDDYQLPMEGHNRFFEARFSASGENEVMAIVRDVTEIRNAEGRIKLLNRLYATLSQINQTIVRAKGREQLFREICEVAVKFGQFKMAWIGLIDEDEHTVKPVIFAGEENGYLSDISIHYLDPIMGGGPTGTAIREGFCAVSRNIPNDPKMKPWFEEAVKHGFLASAAVPIRQNNQVIGAFSVYASEPLAFDQEEENLLTEIGQDISFALDNLQAEVEHNQVIDELVKSEDRYHTLTNISPVGIFQTDANGKTTYVNQTWCKISGLSVEEALGDGWLKAVHPEDKEKVDERWQLNTQKQMASMADYRFIRPDGSVVWVIGQAVPELNSENEIIGYVGTITDITERKQIEDLRLAVEKAESADRLKSSFLATMSHELRTPLNSIIGFTGILLQKLVGPLSAEQEKQLTMVQGSARHLLDLINDVLDISKIEAGEIEIRKEELVYQEIVQKSVEKIHPLAEKKGLKLDVNIQPDHLQLYTDRRRVEQVLLNLLSNAVKFTECGEIKVRSNIEGDQLVTSVSDTGIGIKQEDLDGLFMPFKQVDSGLTRQYEGTGLGLSICKRIVELLDGKIWVESDWGKGSTFSFSLPLIEVKYE